MAGWLVLTYANDAHELFESEGDSFIEVAQAGYPKRQFAETGVVSVEWFAEEPKLKGKTVDEVEAEEEAKAAKEAEKEEKAEAKAEARK